MKMILLDVVARPSKLILDFLPVPLIGFIILMFILACFLIYRLYHQKHNTNDSKIIKQSKGQK